MTGTKTDGPSRNTTRAEGEPVSLTGSELEMLRDLRRHLGAASDAEALRHALAVAHQTIEARR